MSALTVQYKSPLAGLMKPEKETKFSIDIYNLKQKRMV